MLIVIEANDDGETFSPPETQQRNEASDEQLEQMVTALMIHGLQSQQLQRAHGIKPPKNGDTIIVPATMVSHGAF